MFVSFYLENSEGSGNFRNCFRVSSYTWIASFCLKAYMLCQCLYSSPVNPDSSSGILDVALPNTTLTNSQNHDENKHELITTSIDKLPDSSLQDCKALVPVPEMTMEALAVVPLNPKSKRSEVVQRRTRRPFSVSEVEALVQAVEELGTGRFAIAL